MRDLYETRRSQGWKLVAVLGDLNDTPDSDPLKPLLKSGSDLTDIFAHPKFVPDDREGTHGNCTGSSKIDYLLPSPAPSKRVTAAGVNRRGIWGGKNGALFPHLPEVTSSLVAASDHAALWVDVG